MMDGVVRISRTHWSFGRVAGRTIAIHDWRFMPSNHLTAKKIIDIQTQDFRLPFKPKPNSRLRGTNLYGPESTHFFRFVLWNRIKNYQPQRAVPPLAELKEDWKYTIGTIWFIWSFILLYIPQKWIHLVAEQTPWLPAKTDGSRRPKQRSPMIWWML